MASVSFHNVVKRFGSVEAVRDLSLDVIDCEFLVLLGPSGCGKTTTMRMVAGLEEATEGEIFIADQKVNDVLPKYRDVAMVFQSYALYPHFSVADNIGYPLKIRNVSAEERDRRVLEAARRVELEDLLHRRPRELSGGQRQRVALARAIVRTPRVFLMDEPLSNLDAKLRVQMRSELKRLQRDLQVTTIYVTHDQIEAMTLADRVAVMNEGIIEQLGSPKEIYNDPHTLFVAGFVGSPAMNLIPGTVENGVFNGSDVLVKGLGNLSAKNVVLGVRPEDLEVVAADDKTAAIVKPMYAFELTGESSLIAIQAGSQLLHIRADKDFAGEMDQKVGVSVHTDKVFLFDEQTEKRIGY